jgi:hypothetical protein
MLDTKGKLASIEGTLKDLLIKLGVVEAQNLGENDNDKRRRKLLKLTLKALRELDSDSGAAMSLDTPLSDSQEAAVAALSRRMGVLPR